MKQVKVLNRSHPLAAPLIAGYCQDFFCKLRGLMFRKELPAERGLILVTGGDQRIGAAVHMMGMSFDLGLVWIDSQMRVVDRRVARRWTSFFVPKNAAQFVLEFGAERIEEFRLGDQIVFEEVEQV